MKPFRPQHSFVSTVAKKLFPRPINAPPSHRPPTPRIPTAIPAVFQSRHFPPIESTTSTSSLKSKGPVTEAGKQNAFRNLAQEICRVSSDVAAAHWRQLQMTRT